MIVVLFLMLGLSSCETIRNAHVDQIKSALSSAESIHVFEFKDAALEPELQRAIADSLGSVRLRDDELCYCDGLTLGVPSGRRLFYVTVTEEFWEENNTYYRYTNPEKGRSVYEELRSFLFTDAGSVRDIFR